MHAKLQHSCCPAALPGTRRSPMPQRCCIVRCWFQHGQLSVKAIVYFPSPSGNRWCSVGFRLALVLPESPLSSGRKISSCLLTYLPLEGTADAESKIPFVENPELTNFTRCQEFLPFPHFDLPGLFSCFPNTLRTF